MESLSEVHGRRPDHLHAIGGNGVLALAAAGIADAEDLQIVKGGSEFLPIANLELAFFEDRIVELDHRAAGGADEVVVVGVAFDVLVVVVVLAEVDAADHAGLHEELEGAIDGGAGDLDRLLLHLEEQLVGLEMVVCGEDLADEGDALAGEAKAQGSEEVLEAVDFAFDGRHV